MVFLQGDTIHVLDSKTNKEVAFKRVPLKKDQGIYLEWCSPSALVSWATPHDGNGTYIAYAVKFALPNWDQPIYGSLTVDGDFDCRRLEISDDAEGVGWLIGAPPLGGDQSEWYLHIREDGPVKRIVSQTCSLSSVQLGDDAAKKPMTLLVSTNWIGNKVSDLLVSRFVS